MSKAVLFFADGTEECEALLVADLLRRARVEVIIASAMGRRALVSSHGIHLNADALAEDVDYSDVDMVILPGGIPGTPNLAENKTVTDTCVSFAKAGKKIAAICAGTSMRCEVFVHGALCMSVSGQCYLSSVLGERSGNRGRGAHPAGGTLRATAGAMPFR